MTGIISGIYHHLSNWPLFSSLQSLQSEKSETPTPETELPTFESSSVGSPNMGPRNVRIITINGIGYQPIHCKDMAEVISKMFSGIQVDSAYLGITKNDVVHALKLNTPKIDHFIRPLQKKLTDTFNEIKPSDSEEEDNSPVSEQTPPLFWQGDETESRIVVVIHSGGAAFMRAALKTLPKEIAEKIHVLTFGGACQIGTEGVAEASNFIHKNDLIPTVSWPFTKNPDKNTRITYFGSRWTPPMQGHAFLGKENLAILKKELGTSIVDKIVAIVKVQLPIAEGTESETGASPCEKEINIIMLQWNKAFPNPKKSSSVTIEEI